MSFELTEILNRCNRQDVDFLLSLIDSCINFTDGKGLRELYATWDGEIPIPLALNHKIETEIRYLGSNDFAYMTRKLRGQIPAGVSIDEIIDDLCKLLKLDISTASTLEARLEIFAGNLVDQQFAKLPDQRKRDLIDKMNFDRPHREEILNRVIKNKELLLPVILPILGRTVGPEVFQGLIIAILAPFVGLEIAKQLATQIVARIPVLGPWLGPLMIGATAIWSIVDLTGPASRKTIPLILYLGVLCLRDGETGEFTKNLKKLS